MGNDTAICQGQSIILDAGNPGANFNWSTLENTQTIAVDSAATYSVTLTNANGCSATDDIIISINPLPVVNMGNDTAICQGQSIILDVGNPGANFNWSTLENTQTIAVDSAATYSVTLTNANGCSATDDIIISINPLACGQHGQ